MTRSAKRKTPNAQRMTPNINRALRRTFWNVYDNLGFVIAATTLWLILSLTIILLPPVTAALFYVSNQIILDKSVKIKDFFKAIPRYFFKSIFLFIAFCVLCLLPLANIKFYVEKFALTGMLFAGISFWFFLFSALSSMYIFPLLVKNNRYINVLKYCYILVFSNIKFTLLLIAPILLFLFLEVVIPFIGIGILAIFMQNAFLEIESRYNKEIKIQEPNRHLREIWRIWDFS